MEPLIGKINPLHQMHTGRQCLIDQDLAAEVFGVPNLALSTSWS